jgi:hypothetical protein
MAKLKTYTKQEATRISVKSALLEIKATAIEYGSCPLYEIRNGRSTGRRIPEWEQIVHLAPECLQGPRSERWLWELVDKVGIVIDGGKPRKGPLTAYLVENKED